MIDHQLSVGDVVAYTRDNRTERVGLVVKHEQDGKIWCRWRSWYTDTHWERGQFWVHQDEPTLKLHPDGAKLWADYCAAVLRGEEVSL